MLALLPHPNVVGIMSATTPQTDGQFAPRAQARAILAAACLSLNPRRIMEATAHSLIRAAAHAKRRVECPAQLRAAIK